MALGGPASIGFGQRDFSLPMAETHSAAVDQPAADDLISFLKAIPVGVSLLRRSWPLPPRGALPTVVLAAGGGVGDPERLPQLP
jgi:hypothetical protein